MSVSSMVADLSKEVVRCVCGTWTKPRLLRIEGLRVRGSVCPKCGETYLNGEDAQMLSDFRRVRDSLLEGKVTRTGNSYAVRIPISLVRALRLQNGAAVRIRVRSPKEILVSVD